MTLQNIKNFLEKFFRKTYFPDKILLHETPFKKYKKFPGKIFLQTLLLGTCFSKWKRL
jgi:hypothetical protein